MFDVNPRHAQLDDDVVDLLTSAFVVEFGDNGQERLYLLAFFGSETCSQCKDHLFSIVSVHIVVVSFDETRVS